MSQDQICAHERMLDVHDYCPDCGELRTSWLLEGAKLRARIAELEASNAELREALQDVKALAEFWIGREYVNDKSESEYRIWLALGYGSKALRDARAALRAEG